MSLIPWTLAGFGPGLFGWNSRRAATAGAFFGFFLAYVFMVAGYDGSVPVVARLVPFLVFGVVGGVCGVVLALAGRYVRQHSPM